MKVRSAARLLTLQRLSQPHIEQPRNREERRAMKVWPVPSIRLLKGKP